MPSETPFCYTHNMSDLQGRDGRSSSDGISNKSNATARFRVFASDLPASLSSTHNSHCGNSLSTGAVRSRVSAPQRKCIHVTLVWLQICRGWAGRCNWNCIPVAFFATIASALARFLRSDFPPSLRPMLDARCDSPMYMLDIINRPFFKGVLARSDTTSSRSPRSTLFPSKLCYH